MLAHLALLGQERSDHRPECIIDEGSHAIQTTSRNLLKRALSAYIFSSLRGYEFTYSSWVATWGRDVYERSVREFVRELDYTCFERVRAERRAIAAGGDVERDRYLSFERSRDWMC